MYSIIFRADDFVLIETFRVYETEIWGHSVEKDKGFQTIKFLWGTNVFCCF